MAFRIYKEPTITVSLVTGASTGIGKATALRLARAGHHTFASMRNTDAGQDLRDLAETEALRLEVIQLDVTDPDACERAVNAVVESGGTVDVLVNNAGIGGGLRSIEETADEQWQATFDTNLFGLVRMTRLVMPHMRKQESGAIINVSSVAARVALAGQPVYNASKSAVEAVSESLAQQVRRFGITVAIIEPGVILTPIFRKGDPDFDPASPYAEDRRRMVKMFEAMVPLASPASDVADTILEAIESEVSLRRYVVGLGGQELVDFRTSMSDEEWANIGLDMTREELNDLYRSLPGGDWFS